MKNVFLMMMMMVMVLTMVIEKREWMLIVEGVGFKGNRDRGLALINQAIASEGLRGGLPLFLSWKQKDGQRSQTKKKKKSRLPSST